MCEILVSFFLIKNDAGVAFEKTLDRPILYTNNMSLFTHSYISMAMLSWVIKPCQSICSALVDLPYEASHIDFKFGSR